jgi:hypothetical protein
MNTLTHAAPDRPLKAWRAAPSATYHPLTHAVLPGQTIAACGVHVASIGGPWPDSRLCTPLARCPVCAQAMSSESMV